MLDYRLSLAWPDDVPLGFTRFPVRSCQIHRGHQENLPQTHSKIRGRVELSSFDWIVFLVRPPGFRVVATGSETILSAFYFNG